MAAVLMRIGCAVAMAGLPATLAFAKQGPMVGLGTATPLQQAVVAVFIAGQIALVVAGVVLAAWAIGQAVEDFEDL